MIVGSSRLVVSGTVIALAVTGAIALAVPSQALATSSEQAAGNPHAAGDATQTTQTANVQRSPVVNRNDGSLTTSVRHQWPTVNDDDDLGPLVRHMWP